MSLEASRRDDQAELHQGISVLLRRMNAAADLAIKLRSSTYGCSSAMGSIEQTRGLIKRFYVALNIEVDWDSLVPIEWSAAIREWRQWRNGLVEVGSLAWEKGKPLLVTIALTVLTAAVKDKVKLPGKPWN